MTNNSDWIARYGNRKRLMTLTVSIFFSLATASTKAQAPPPSDSVATTGLTDVSDKRQAAVWSNGNKINVDFTGVSQSEARIDIYRLTGQLISEEKITTGSIYQAEIDNITGYVVVKITDDRGWVTRKLFISNN